MGSCYSKNSRELKSHHNKAYGDGVFKKTDVEMYKNLDAFKNSFHMAFH